MREIRIGIVFSARDHFPPRHHALENKKRIKPRLEAIFAGMPQVSCIYADDLFADGMMTTIQEAKKVVDYFTTQKIDALFIPHANFGQEESAGYVANAMKVPVLLWGPRDGSPIEGEPFRDTDTQCGLFATTRLLLRYGVPFTYLRNCWLDSEELSVGIDRFIRVASVVKAFRNLRVLQLSNRPRQFLSVMVDESDMLERFGIQMVPVGSAEILEEVERFAKDLVAIQAMFDRWEAEGIQFCGITEMQKIQMAATGLAIQSLADKYDCTTVSSECWSLFKGVCGTNPCFMFGYLSQMGLPVCCENDIHAAISSILAQAAALYETPSFLADITVRHPYDDNAELLWHCGPFPPVLAKGTPKTDGVKGQYELKQGRMTLVRFAADHQGYSIFADECGTTDGPESRGNYVWMKVDDWGKWEDKLMYGPYIHHIAGIYGTYKAVFAEACKYLGVTHDFVS